MSTVQFLSIDSIIFSQRTKNIYLYLFERFASKYAANNRLFSHECWHSVKMDFPMEWIKFMRPKFDTPLLISAFKQSNIFLNYGQKSNYLSLTCHVYKRLDISSAPAIPNQPVSSNSLKSYRFSVVLSELFVSTKSKVPIFCGRKLKLSLANRIRIE